MITLNRRRYMGSKVEEPFFCRLTVNGAIVNVTDTDSSGELTSEKIEAAGVSDTTTITSAEIGSQCTSIGQNVFYGCSGLTSITIPNSVRGIGNYAIKGCTGLTSIIIPNSVMSIGLQAFYGCSGLTTVTIPNSVTSIGRYAFAQCSGLTSINSLATTAPTIRSDTFLNVKSGGTLYVPSDATGYDTWMSSDAYYLGYYNWTTDDISNAPSTP